ncbi:peptidoglycan-binding protein [Microvirga sp. HBU67558]|uniref:peptidoglycan-binding domain-containing protein n=1 Tax=Microvirga TaxID=186650 RepID=UPI001B35E837|nr:MULTISPECIES: peptidoglycan-binding domain-containing protein [unclassified Microvirga]MBQ0819052.1 peptidoglycan-binding protein [Microvirga sp. HBU67558]
MSYVRNYARVQLSTAGTGLLAATAIGFGLFVYSVLSKSSEDHALQSEILNLRQQIETVTAERDQLAKDNERRILAGQDLNTTLKRIEAATEELQQLDSLRSTVSQAIEQARLQLTGPSDQPIATTESRAASTTSSVRLSKKEIRAAQEVLVDFGYGKLKADGTLGPSTRKAVEAFERTKGPPVTGKLGTATLQALRTHTASATQ